MIPAFKHKYTLVKCCGGTLGDCKTKETGADYDEIPFSPVHLSHLFCGRTSRVAGESSAIRQGESMGVSIAVFRAEKHAGPGPQVSLRCLQVLVPRVSPVVKEKAVV